jgi:threonine dehydratase
VLGVEPETGNDGQRSLRAGRIVEIPVPATIADGARTTRLGEHTFAVIRERVADIVTVADAELVAAMRLLIERMKIVVEPTGALAAAAMLGSGSRLAGRRVGVILSGGNLDPATLCRLLAPGSS